MKMMHHLGVWCVLVWLEMKWLVVLWFCDFWVWCGVVWCGISWFSFEFSYCYFMLAAVVVGSTALVFDNAETRQNNSTTLVSQHLLNLCSSIVVWFRSTALFISCLGSLNKSSHYVAPRTFFKLTSHRCGGNLNITSTLSTLTNGQVVQRPPNWHSPLAVHLSSSK